MNYQDTSSAAQQAISLANNMLAWPYSSYIPVTSQYSFSKILHGFIRGKAFMYKPHSNNLIPQAGNLYG